MKPSEVSESIETLLDLKMPGFIWGPPGVGKSDLVAGVANKRGIGLIDFRMALRDPTDIKGFPMPDQATQTMKFYRDGELPTEGEGILFMDELNSAAPATQAAGMQLSLTGRIGDYKLPDGWSIVGAGNRESDRGVVHRMPTPLANRFTHLDFEHNDEDWVNWALDNEITPELIAFIRFRSELLFKFDPKIDSKAFPTPRSWVKTDRIRGSKASSSVKLELIKGTVGEGPGSEFWAFLETINQLPNLEEILLNPDKTPVPENAGVRYALVTLLGAKVSETNFPKMLRYLAGPKNDVNRIDPEFQVVFVRDAMRKEPKVKLLKEFTSWAMKNHEIVVN